VNRMSTESTSVNFPILERLDVDGYGMYPGHPEGQSGLHIQFQPGLTLILGTNGLGKSTLVTLMYRLLTGPYDLRGLSERAELGRANLKPVKSSSVQALFRKRVRDGAKDASARLCFRLGDRIVVVERRLDNLELTRLTVDAEELSPDEQTFQSEMPRLVGVWSFGDWILLLRYLVFYFEERRALVWDASAQRQVLRFLLLPSETAQQWAEDEREILKLDSEARNLRVLVNRQEREFSRLQAQVKVGADVLAELKTLESLQEVDMEQRDGLYSDLKEADSFRQSARLRELQAKQEREARYREVERAKLTAIEARFPARSETARYLLAQLMVEAECLVCGNKAPTAADALSQRIENEECVLCGSDLSTDAEKASVTLLADRRARRAAADLKAIDVELGSAQQELDKAKQEYDRLKENHVGLDAKIAQRSARMEALVRQLPTDDVRRRRAHTMSLRARFDALEKQLDDQRQSFGRFLEKENRRMASQAAAVTEAFNHYAQGFLFEACELVWTSKSDTVGQEGPKVPYQAFEVDLTGSDFPSPVRRSGPEQVSESQREFIDLAFRMALISVAGSGGSGSLVVDAPESSLDTVFSKQASAVLALFADQARGNRLMITTNLVEGSLIPTLLQSVPNADSRASRIVDLFEIGVPTAAIRMHQAEYDEARQKLIMESSS
jgi:hypothetical protein